MLSLVGKTLDDVWDLVWTQWFLAATEPRHPFRWIALGTQAGKRVKQRYVVLREVTEDYRLLFFTDSRAGKVQQLRDNPKASIWAYHPEEKLQVQLEVDCLLHHLDAYAKAYWKDIPDPLRKAYTSRLTPGATIPHPSDAHDWEEGLGSQYFCVVECRPSRMELLQLSGLAHIRAAFELSDKGKTGRWLVP